MLAKWMKTAGITKRIAYHTSQHMFATIMLILEVDFYTVNKLVGHSNVRTIQIYTKIVDSKKIEAINLMDKVFG